MKKKLSFICVIIILAVLLVLIGCSNVENKKTNNSTNFNELETNYNDTTLFENELDTGFDEIELDYNDAISFENALNSGKKVNGKTVKFDVLEYKRDSLLGINCWAGEHLNFISEKELDVKAGDTIIGRVKEEPTSFLGSWEIKYDVIEILEGTQKNDISKDISVEEAENTNIENDQNQSENKIENNKTVENEETNNSDVDNKGTNQRTYNYYTTNDNATAKKGNAGQFSYIKRCGSYDIYWIIDFDEGYVYYFTEGNGEETCEKTKIKSGNLNDGLELSYQKSDYAWVKYLHFKYTNQPHQLIIIDNNYFEYEYSTTSLEDALELMKTKRTIET